MIDALSQRIVALEEKIAELESLKLRRSADHVEHRTTVHNNIEHLEERLRLAEDELAEMNDSQISSELQHDCKVDSSCFSELLIFEAERFMSDINLFPLEIIIIIIITSTIFIVLSSTAPAICESSLWFIWAKVGQRDANLGPLAPQASVLPLDHCDLQRWSG